MRAPARADRRAREENLLGRDVQCIHAIWVTPEEIRALASAGTPVASPYTDCASASAFPADGRIPRGRTSRSGLSWTRRRFPETADMFAI